MLIPVSDVDKAKDFYPNQAGFHLDVDHQAGENFRALQCSPPGSACCIGFGIGINEAGPGSAQGLHLVVNDSRQRGTNWPGGVAVNDIGHMGESSWQPGAHPDRADYTSFADRFCADGADRSPHCSGQPARERLQRDGSPCRLPGSVAGVGRRDMGHGRDLAEAGQGIEVSDRREVTLKVVTDPVEVVSIRRR